MIHGYSDHAANERTFLAWVRTGIAVIAFGFVIERFNLFLLALANANAPLSSESSSRLESLSRSLGRYDGLVLIVGGIAVIVVAAVRFVRTRRHIDDTAPHPVGSTRAELVLAAFLAVIFALYAAYIAID